MKRYLNLVAFCSFLLFFYLSIERASAQWVSTGPDGGFIKCSAGSGDSLYTATGYYGNSIYFSADGGNNWTLINSISQPTNVNTMLKVGNSLFLGCGSSLPGSVGVYRSVDNGLSWQSKLDIESSVKGMAAQGNTIYAITSWNGILRSVDNGENWIDVTNNLPDNYFEGGLVVTNSAVYVSLGSDFGVFRSTDSGNTWVWASNGIDNYATVLTLASIGNDLYAGTDQFGLYKSSDEGETWISLDPSTTINYWDYKFITGDSTTLFAITYRDGILRSTDKGATWSLSINGIDVYDQANSLFESGGTVFAGTKAGMYRTTDNGDNWTEANTGIHAHMITIPTFASLDSNLYVGSRYAGVYRSSDKGYNWENVSYDLPINTTDLPALNSDSSAIFSYDLLSTDSGNSWVPTNSPGTVGNLPWIEHSGALFTINSSMLYDGIYRSVDNGTTWTTINNGIDPVSAQYLSLHSDGSSLLLGNYLGAYYSNNNGDTWTLCSFPDEFTGPVIPNTYVAMDSNKFCGFGSLYGRSGIYRSTDNCANWTKVNDMTVMKLVVSGNTIYASGTLEEIVNGELIDVPTIIMSLDNGLAWQKISDDLGMDISPLSLTAVGQNLFISKVTPPNYGVYFTADKGVNWIDVNLGLPRQTFVTSFKALGNELFAGTLWNSLWRISLNSFSLPSQPSAINGAVNPCIGSTQIYSVTNEPGVTYAWQFPTGWVVTAGATASTVTVTVGSTPGIVLVTPSTFAGVGPAQYLVVSANTTISTPVISQVGNTLYSDAATGNQWYINNTPINGATGASFNATTSGTYYCVVAANGCQSYPSNSVAFIYTGIADLKPAKFEIFPSPNNGMFKTTIESTNAKVFTLRVYNTVGSLVYVKNEVSFTGSSTQNFNLQHLPSGIYMVTFTSGNKSVSRKMIINHN